MPLKPSALISFAFILMFSFNADAGFYIKTVHNTAIYTITTTSQNSAIPSIDTILNKKQRATDNEEKIPDRFNKESGWRGSISFTFAILGVVMSSFLSPFYALFYIPAFILGVQA